MVRAVVQYYFGVRGVGWQSMKTSLFAWKDREIRGNFQLWFRDCKLLCDICGWKEGTLVDLIIIDVLEGEMTLCCKGCEELTVDLDISVALRP